MSIILVRHGETEGNAARVLQRPEIPLSATGIRQAERLAERLRILGGTRLLCSDLTRAQMTAEPIARALGLRIETTPLLQERNFGDLRGTPYAALDGDPFAPDLVPPNGESWDAFHARVAEVFDLVRLARAETHGNLIVVTHGLVCRALVARHVECVGGQVVPARFDNTSVTVLESKKPWRAQLVNCCAHLADAEAAHPGGLA